MFKCEETFIAMAFLGENQMLEPLSYSLGEELHIFHLDVHFCLLGVTFSYLYPQGGDFVQIVFVPLNICSCL